MEPAFRRNTRNADTQVEAAHNPEVAGSSPAPLPEWPRNGALFFAQWKRERLFCERAFASTGN